MSDIKIAIIGSRDFKNRKLLTETLASYLEKYTMNFTKTLEKKLIVVKY